LIFSNKGEAARTDFLMKLLSSTYTPITPMNTIAAEVKRGYGSDVVPGSLASDCLSPADTGKLEQVLRDEKFELIFLGNNAVPRFQCNEATMSKFKDSWADAMSALRAELNRMKASVQHIKKESTLLLQTRRLCLERQSPALVGILCEKAQPRIKLAFVRSEERIVMRNSAAAVEMFVALSDLVSKLREHECIRTGHFFDVQKKHRQVEQAFNKSFQELGFQDTADFLSHRMMWASGAVAVTGAGGLAVTIGASSTFSGWWGGTAALSLKCGAGLALGGVALVGGVIICAVTAGWSWRNEAWSQAIRDALMEAFDDLLLTSTALLDHKKRLDAITQTLKSLEIL